MLDWISLVLAVIAPPVGILAGIAALIVSLRRNGWTGVVAKVAIAIGVVLTIGLVVAGFVFSNVAGKQAAYQP